MNKAQLVEKLSQKTKTTKIQSEAFLDATLDVIQKTVARGEEVKIVGFGTFSQISKKEKKARNPKTGEEVIIPPLNAPRFRPGKEFKDLVK